MHTSFVTRHLDRPGHVSGVMSWLNVMRRELERQGVVVSIISSARAGRQNQTMPGVHFPQWSPLAFRRRIRHTGAEQVIFVSSTSRPAVLFWWWIMLAWMIPGRRRSFYQTTNFLRPPGRFLTALLHRSFDHVIAANALLSRQLGDSPRTPVPVLHPAIEMCQSQTMTSRTGNARVIGFMGHYSRLKGADRFVALSTRPALADYQFVIAGGPTYETRQTLFIAAQEQSANQANLTALGVVPDPLATLAGFDLLVLPYRSGATVLAVAQTAIEAMALGIPVVGTHNAALDDLIVHGYNGFYCDDEDDFEQAIITILSDAGLYRSLSENALRSVTEHFSVAQRITELMDMTHD